jgi:hypothetical protein
MAISDIDKLEAFGKLNQYFAQATEAKPTEGMAAAAVKHLFRTYGAESEEELMQKAIPELIEYYKEMKSGILKTAQ